MYAALPIVPGTAPRTVAKTITPPSATIAYDVRHRAGLCGSTSASNVMIPGSEKCRATPYERRLKAGSPAHTR